MYIIIETDLRENGKKVLGYCNNKVEAKQIIKKYNGKLNDMKQYTYKQLYRLYYNRGKID